MKVGDLVTLSAYGKKVKRTGWVKEGDIGVITKCKSMAGWYSYTIMWNQSITRPNAHHAYRVKYKTRGSSWDWSSTFDRRDLRYATAWFKRSK